MIHDPMTQQYNNLFGQHSSHNFNMDAHKQTCYDCSQSQNAQTFGWSGTTCDSLGAALEVLEQPIIMNPAYTRKNSLSTITANDRNQENQSISINSNGGLKAIDGIDLLLSLDQVHPNKEMYLSNTHDQDQDQDQDQADKNNQAIDQLIAIMNETEHASSQDHLWKSPSMEDLDVSPSSLSSSSSSSAPTLASTPSILAPSASLSGNKRKRSKSEKLPRSYGIFMSYVKENPQTGEVDVDGIFSEECFLEWLNTRKKKVKNKYESFRRALMSHLTGQDSRKPFAPEIEEALLRVVRATKVWTCFQNKYDDEGKPVQVGLYGFRGQGYFEKMRAP